MNTTTDIALISIGQSLVNMIRAVDMLGHERPTNSLVYLASAEPNMALDFTRWCQQGPGWEDARDRCMAIVRMLPPTERTVPWQDTRKAAPPVRAGRLARLLRVFAAQHGAGPDGAEGQGDGGRRVGVGQERR